MEYVILGLLMLRGFTIYELNKSFKQGISLFYSASYGSLQFAVKKLLSGGYIEVEESRDGGRKKKIYAITDSGRQLFLDWMRSGEVPSNHFESVALSKLYFLGMVDSNADKKLILERIIETIRQAEQSLMELDKQLTPNKVPAPYQDVFRYQLKSLDYGIQAHRFSRLWFEEALRAIEES